MGLIDLKSNLSWYGDEPPQVNNLRDEDATGYTTGNNQVGGISEFQGISGQFTGTGLSYTHTGIQRLGVLTETNFFLNTDHRGFRAVRAPGDQSDYTGVNSVTLRYTHTGNQNLGVIGITNSFLNSDMSGFTTLRQPLQNTEFQGVDSAQSMYIHTGVQSLGTLALTNSFPEINAIGFRANKTERGKSDFVGVDNLQTGYQHTGVRGLGDLSKNLRPLDSLGNPERDTFVRGAINNFTTRYSQSGGPTAQLGVLSANVKGFAFQGVSELTPLQKSAADAFPINSVTFSQQGISSRTAQLGSGTKFPIGPAGQVHEFDIVRTGFSGAVRYGDVYGPRSNSGLADTYTVDSPIDDMYNKFKVRDEAYNPFTFGFTRQPFILRGIQRDDNSKPQRWGGFAGSTASSVSSLFDIPRGGPLAFGERTVFDVLRLGKFSLSPRGLAFITKQFGFQAMNPNVENEEGEATKRLRPTQFYDPLSYIVNATTSALGFKFDRHGLPAGVRPLRGKYEQVVNIDRTDKVGFNRLVKLRAEYGLDGSGTAIDPGDLETRARAVARGNEVGSRFSQILSAASGPKSILGIGRTNIGRDESTHRFRSGIGDDTAYSTMSTRLGGVKGTHIIRRQNTYARTYTTNVRNGDAPATRSEIDAGENLKLIASDNRGAFGGQRRETDEKLISEVPNTDIKSAARRVYHKSLKQNAQGDLLWLNNQGMKGTLADDERFRGGGVASSRVDVAKSDTAGTNRDETVSTDKRNSWVAMSYDKLRGAAKERSDNPNKLLNFQLMSRGIAPGSANYDAGIILGDKLLRFAMYEKGNTNVIDKDSTATLGDGEFKDLIKFKIGAVHFEAYIDSISDSSSPGLASSNDSGVLLPRYRPESYSREISVEFKMIATSPDHLAVKWQKMKKLMAISVPISGNGTVTTLTIGNLYNDLPVVCNNFECSWDGETNWEIHKDWQVPILTTCSLSFNVLTMKKEKFFAVDPTTALANWISDHETHIGS